MPFARRTWRVASACLAAWSYASLALSAWAEMLNWMSAVSGAVSNLPSAPTKMVLGTGLSVGLCAIEGALRTRMAQSVTMAVFIGSLLELDGPDLDGSDLDGVLKFCILKPDMENECKASLIHLCC